MTDEKQSGRGIFEGNESHGNRGPGFLFEGGLPEDVDVTKNAAWNNQGAGFHVIKGSADSSTAAPKKKSWHETFVGRFFWVFVMGGLATVVGGYIVWWLTTKQP